MDTRTLTLIFSILLTAMPVLAADAPNQGIFTSVTGDVQILTNNRNERAKEDMTVVEGDRIMTAAGSAAVLKLFDGSELTIAENTDFTLAALQKPSADDKVIKFKLLLGTLSALVQKLTTSHSAFEIESGGVVCGVRGTQFSVFCNGAKIPQVTVQVTSGSVYTLDTLGHNFIVHPGGIMHFSNGSYIAPPTGPNTQGNNTNKKTGDSQTTGGSIGNGGSTTNGSTGNTGSTTTASGDASGTTSGGNSNNPPAGGSGNPPAGNTGADNGLADLNHQFQNNVLVNGDSTLTNPAVQQAIQININPVIGH